MTTKQHSHAWLKKQTDAELITLYNNISTSPHPDPSFYLNELSTREQARISRGMFWMTVAITIMTATNVLLVGVQLYLAATG